MTDHTFFEVPVTTADLHTVNLVENCIESFVPYGHHVTRYWYFDGLLILHTRTNFAAAYQMEKRNNLDAVGLEFNLKGSYIIRHVGKVYQTRSPQHNIIYTPGFHNTFENAELYGETFKIMFTLPFFLRIVEESNETLKRFASKLLEGNPAVISQNSLVINFPLQQAIQDIIHCQFTGGLKKLFLLSKSIEILVLQAEAYHRAESRGSQHTAKAGDRERIDYAREYLIRNYTNPPSLSELSKITGLNEYKLKRGFKETFNTTVFGYLSDFRLSMAREALLENNASVSEIADSLGYSSSQHFSKAFKKKFGISPRSAKPEAGMK